MKRESLVVLLGLAIFTVPFLGVPRAYTEIVFVSIGILLMIIGYSLRRSEFLRSLEQEDGERHADAFVESVIPEINEVVETEQHST